MRHTAAALRRPVACMMFFTALAVIGMIAARMLPLERFPDIDFPGMFIMIPYEGSTPEEVERLITRPVEEVLATLPNLKQMTSTSNESGAQIGIFMGWDQDMTTTGIDARVKVESIRDRLPADLRRLQIFTGSTSDQPVLTLRISGERDLSDAYEVLDRVLKRRLERLEGVSRVELQGVDPQEIRILLDSDRVAAHGVDLNDLRSLLDRSNFSVSAGRISADGMRFSVRPRGEFESLEDIAALIISGTDLRLRDVASIEMRAPERSYGRRLDGSYSIGLNVFRTPGSNIVEVADRVNAELVLIDAHPEMQGIRVFEMDNQASSVRQSLGDLLRAGGIGALLAFIVLYLFLRQWTTTLIVTLAVPFSLLVTLAVMYFANISLNILSMMGLMLAIGMLVDNSVVVTESIFRHRQLDPKNPFEATLRGVREVGVAVMAGTATTVAVFLPIMFGERIDMFVFLTHVAITISVAVIASLVIAQTLIPMLASRVAAPPEIRGQRVMGAVTAGYVWLLGWTLRHRWWTLVTIIVIIVTGFTVPTKFVKFDFMPEEPSRRLFLPYNIDGNYPLARVGQAVERIESFLLEHREALEIESVYSFYEQGRAESTILLIDDSRAKVPTEKIVAFIRDNLPEIIIGTPAFRFDQQTGGEGFSVRVTGDSTEVLAGIAEEARRRLLGLEGFDRLSTDAASGEREVQVRVDVERAARLMLTPQQVGEAIRVAMRGDQLREFRGAEGELAIRLAYRESDRQAIEDLQRLPLYTPDGQRVVLGSIADFEITRGARAIRRDNRRTAITISGPLSPGTSLDDMRPKVAKVLNDLEYPPGYGWSYGRSFQSNEEAQALVVQSIALAIVLIFLIMAALFESTLFPLSILISIVFSVIGVLWFFALTGTTFSFMAWIGVLILIGVVVNNGIVLVDHINRLRWEGAPRMEAIIEGGRHRLRPILMTVATTVLGLTPLAIGSTQVGGDGPPYYPMARAIIGGLTFSTLVSLLVVPFVYSLLDDSARWGRRLLRLSASQPAGAQN
ncbi:MAG: efflux RND transporter permease subunit [Gammaproteobacteria bacterium]|nr:efflux RND transporter permease subunit [Gammaproteobacteria bacterium]